MKASRKVYAIIKEIFAWVFALVVIIPFLIVVFNSFKTAHESINMSLTPPNTLHWENFKKVWEVGNIPRSYMNSFIISATSVLLSVLSASTCAYVISRNRTKINRAIYIFFALGLMFPISMVTVVKITRLFYVYNTVWGVILMFTALILPLSVFLYYGFLDSVPKELDEAALVDGAGALRIFFQILFPVLKPVTVTVVTINFLNCWNIGISLIK